MKRAFRTLGIFLSALFLLTACSSEDEENYTEVWTMYIEPEYVIGSSYWGAEAPWQLQMEATNDNGERIGRFYPGEIQGFEYEEGYRYKVEVYATDRFAKSGQIIFDASKYSFVLKNVLSKEYVGYRQEGRREVTMDLRMVKFYNSPYSTGYHHFLSGTTTDGSETINFSELEIIGLNTRNLVDWSTNDGNHTYYRCRMRLSITPSVRPVYREHMQRYRFLELISRERLDSDSVVVATNMEEILEMEKLL